MVGPWHPGGWLAHLPKDSDIKTKDCQQLKYHGSVKPRGEWTPLMKQAFEQVRATVVSDVEYLYSSHLRSLAWWCVTPRLVPAR